MTAWRRKDFEEYSEQVAPLDVEPVLQLGEVHDNDYVHEKMAFIRNMISNKRER